MTQNGKTSWTDSQQAAIDHVAGSLLVSAAAGSGKTAVLSQRCARLVCDLDPDDGGCPVDALLVLTFTDAAANEMRTRIAQAIRQRLTKNPDSKRARWLKRQVAMVDRASISTLHAFCSRVLRQHFHETAANNAAAIDPAFEVIDQDEALLLRDETLAGLLAKKLKPADPNEPAQRDFMDFYETYAQSRESSLRDMILSLHRLLEATADPNDFLAKARQLYSPTGSKDTLKHYVTVTLAETVRLAHLSATRFANLVKSRIGPCQMLTALQGAADALAEARHHLQKNNFAAAHRAVDYAWPDRLSSMKDVDDFDLLKEHTYGKLKTAMEKLRDETFAIQPPQLLADLQSLGKPLETLIRLTEEFAVAYTTAKRSQNRLDFADLERLTLDLLTADRSPAAAELKARYRYLLVDEFQDINPLQAALLHAISDDNLFIVGDVKQSIYGFRLADPQLFINRELAARKSSTKTKRTFVSLPHNFRSHPSLLTAMNAIFHKLLTPELACVNYANDHALQPAPNTADTPNPPVELHLVVMQQPDNSDDSAENGNGDAAPIENLSAVDQEAHLVARRIRELIDQKQPITPKGEPPRPIKYRDIAILLRSPKNKAMIFARALSYHGIPVHADLSTGYFDAPEVADTLNLLRVLDNPQQDIPLAGLLLSPYAGTESHSHFTHDELATIRLAYDKKLVSFHEAINRYGKKIAADRTAAPLNAALADRLAQFFDRLNTWRAALRNRPLHEGLALIFDQSRILPFLAGRDAGTQRIANLKALHQRALKFAGFRKQGLHRFLRFIEKFQDNPSSTGDWGEAPVLSEASNVVRIMSVHKSKGLEFPVVFVSALGTLFNLVNPAPVHLHRDIGIGLDVVDDQRNIGYSSAASCTITDANKRAARAEELRLLYVALTRARDQLILTGHLATEKPLETARALWSDWPSVAPLPEDQLLKARCALDWLLPALAANDSSQFRIDWPHHPKKHPQLIVQTHAPQNLQTAADDPALAQTDDTIRALLAATPLNEAVAPIDTSHLLERIKGDYAHVDLATKPAVYTVTQLKSLIHSALPDADNDEPVPAMLPAINSGLRTQDSGLKRGTATHRVLELLDLAAATPDNLLDLVNKLAIPPEDLALVDLPAIQWLLASPAGELLRNAARDKKSYDLRRELPFTWLANTQPQVELSLFALHSLLLPQDLPTIRGTIDVLVFHRPSRTAQIIDYKTDSPRSWKQNLPAYQEQMRYYLRAASDILQLPVKKATLIFLAAQQIKEVTPD